jgi:hypothetical protein
MVDTAIERNLDTGLITITIKTPPGIASARAAHPLGKSDNLNQ